MKPLTFQRAASESVVARMVARIMGVAGSDHWHEVAQRAAESDAAQHVPWSLPEVSRYPWVVNVPQSMFECSVKSQLIIDLAADPGTLYLVNDESLPGTKGIWLLVADDAGNGDNNAGYAAASAPVMMLVNHAFFPSHTYTIVAIQLLSCLRQK